MADSRFEYIGSRPKPSANALFDIVFVHGITGDCFGTWTHSNGEYWPKWVAGDFENVNVYSAGYDSSLVGSLKKGAGASLSDRATILLDRLANRVAPHRPLVFITHSLGGLIVKQMLRKAQDASSDRRKRVGGLTRATVFIATPHSGSQLPKAVNTLLRIATSKSIRELEYKADALIDLAQWFSTYATNNQIKVESYYEVEKYLGNLIVDQVTANPNVFGCGPVAIQADHVTITKLENRDAQLYQSVCGFLQALLEEIQASGGGAGSSGDDEIAGDFAAYTTQAPADRRSLAQKLTDAERAHLITRAEAQKERFAMTLQRNIAQPAAVRRYTRLMSNVETRFHRHIAPLIANGADNQTVDAALQDQVLDAALKADDADGADGTSALVDRAFYYLAGNCHVSWDNG
ncbi:MULTISPECIES: ABC-three component system protein [unclassified Brevundimonas]|uniref:ABC-three component system protein n=1 Tax=unclassified Brevundimonas TaxID=2622653 RepID=UPI0025BEDA11|nr:MULTISPECIES: ABC-three component system protein [unclassified Brevundimonas]